MSKDALAQLAIPRTVFPDRLTIANQIAFWRRECDRTADPIKLASYNRILSALTDIAERLDANA